MKQISIGGGALSASRIALGCMRISRTTKENADRLVKTALELGIDFFDHADVYGAGNSERVFGEILDLKSSIREKIKIQSKCTLVRDAVQTLYNDQSKDYIIASVDNSLKRLKTEYLDVFLLHQPDTLVEPEEVADAFHILRTTGKVRYFGVSNHKPYQIMLLEKDTDEKIIVNQLQLSAAHTGLIDASNPMKLKDEFTVDGTGDILTWCRLNDITIQAWSPFQHGFYGGVFMESENYPELNHVVNDIAKKKSVSTSAIAIAWILRHPAGIQPLIGTTNADRLKDICTADDVELNREEWYEIYRASLRDEGKAELGNSEKKQKS